MTRILCAFVDVDAIDVGAFSAANVFVAGVTIASEIVNSGYLTAVISWICTIVTPGCIATIGRRTALMPLLADTFIDVSASGLNILLPLLLLIALETSTFVGAGNVDAHGVFSAPNLDIFAFVDIPANCAISRESRLTLAVEGAVGVYAICIFVAIIQRRILTLVDVVAESTVAGITGLAKAIE